MVSLINKKGGFMDYKGRIDSCLKAYSCVLEGISRLEKEHIEIAINILFAAWKKEKNIFVIGNGGSASTATHFAADLVKTVVGSPGKRGLKAIALVDNIPLNSALVNDRGKESLFIEPLRTFFKPADIVVAFSVHGGSGEDKDGLWSQNIIQAIRYSKEHRGKSVGFSGFDGGVMKNICDVCIIVPVNSTPIVESLHLVLAHLITSKLKELINE
jgi:phosphoheptose isomerase